MISMLRQYDCVIRALLMRQYCMVVVIQSCPISTFRCTPLMPVSSTCVAKFHEISPGNGYMAQPDSIIRSKKQQAYIMPRLIEIESFPGSEVTIFEKGALPYGVIQFRRNLGQAEGLAERTCAFVIARDRLCSLPSHPI